VTGAPPRAEVVGSLLRPERLRRAREERAAGRLAPAEFKSVEDAEVDRAIALQEGAGLTVVTDGGMRHAIHLCRGNRDGHWMASGGYEAISKEVFTRATRFERFFLEYDDERSGGFEPLRDLPPDRTVVLGLVSTKRTELEDAGALLGRIDEAARFYPRDQLAVSPQCGFESAIGDYPLDEAQQEQKLRLVVELAERGWAA
jgi:5-methyltetrahydropteroyltriglutamate--homocysteine methyltransferase